MQLLAAEPAMTLVKRETVPVSEGQTIIRSHYLYQPPAVAGVQPKATTITKELIVVGCGVNYDANRGVGEPNLVPSQAALSPGSVEGVAFESTASPLEVFLPETADLPLIVGKNSRTVSSRIAGAAEVAPQAVDAKTARYANVFPDTDLEWQVGNGYLKESLILRSQKAPAGFILTLESGGLEFLVPDRARTDGSYMAIPAAAQGLRIKGHVMLADTAVWDNHQVLIPEATVADAAGREVPMECFVSRRADGAVEYKMRVPDAFLADPSLTFPLTVDPTYYNVPVDGVPLVYEAGKTYFISSTVMYVNKNVRFEANTIVKYDLDTKLLFEWNDSVRVEGTPYNYAIFTSALDDTVGVNTDINDDPVLPDEGDPTPGSYPFALAIRGDNDGGPFIRYAKFAYAGDPETGAGAAVYLNEYSADINARIEHCVFRNNKKGVYSYSSESVNNHKVTVRNCLFVGDDEVECTGIHLLSYYGDPVWNVTNCTFDNFNDNDEADHWLDAGICFQYWGQEHGYDVRRNVFHNCHYTMSRYYHGKLPDPDLEDDLKKVSHNGFDTQGDAIGYEYETNSDPFQTNPNGSYYLKPTCEFRDTGDISAVDAGLSTRTTVAASAGNGRIVAGTINTSTYWGPLPREEDTKVDLGYHYDPVDYIVSSPIDVDSPGELHIFPGVVVAFGDVENGANGIATDNSGKLVFEGNGSAPIRFSGTQACGDIIGKLGYPGGGTPHRSVGFYNLYQGITVAAGGTGTFEYCTVENARHGLTISGSLSGPITGCRFSSNHAGIRHNTVDHLIVQNSLFCYGLVSGSTGLLVNADYNFTLVNCTFSNQPTGISVDYYDPAPAWIRNCIFANCNNGISTASNNGQYVEVTYSCFFNNLYSHADSSVDLSGTGNLVDVDPMFENAAAPDLYARFHLDQDDSPCLNAGSPNDTRYLSTALDERLDIGNVDIGYHYPSRGLLRVSVPDPGQGIPGNYFFQYENGEYVYPISVSLGPFSIAVGSSSAGYKGLHPIDWDNSAFWNETVPAYVETLAKHGVNMMRVYPFAGSVFLQPSLEDQDSDGTSFQVEGVDRVNSFLNALEAEGLSYVLATYDSYAMAHRTDTGARADDCVYFQRDHTTQTIPGGTVPTEWRGQFFREDGWINDQYPPYEPVYCNARDKFDDTLALFVQNWFYRRGLIGWDVFAWIDAPEIGYPFDVGNYPDREECEDPHPVYDTQGKPAYFERKRANWNGEWHENALSAGPDLIGYKKVYEDKGWVEEMLGVMKTIEPVAMGPGWTRPLWVSVSAPFRYKAADPGTNRDQPDYLDDGNNDVIDYGIDTPKAATVLSPRFDPLRIHLGEMSFVTGSSAAAPDYARVWDARTVGRSLDGNAYPRLVLSGHTAPVKSVAYAKDIAGNRMIATGSQDGTAKVWDAVTGTQKISVLGNGGSGVNAVAFWSVTQLVVGSSNGYVEVFNVADGTPYLPSELSYQAHTSVLNSVAHRSNNTNVDIGNIILSGGESGLQHQWTVKYEKKVHAVFLWQDLETSQETDEVRSVALSPSGDLALIGVGNIARLYRLDDPSNPVPVVDFVGEYGAVNSVAFSPDGNSAITGGEWGLTGNGEWNLYTYSDHDGDLRTREWRATPDAYARNLSGGPIRSVAMYGFRILAGSSNGSSGRTVIWDVSDQASPQEIQTMSNWEALSVAFGTQPEWDDDAGEFVLDNRYAFGCTLPEIIDHYRISPKKGGFFSSGVYMGSRGGTGAVKRLINDIHHSELWLGFASGSVGGPTVLDLPAQDGSMDWYDVSGKEFLNERGITNPPDPGPYGFDKAVPLGSYSDEILDSMLSLRRFTSLVRWRYVGEAYRPVRSANSPVDMALVSSQDGLPTNEQLYADDDWLWTAASDRRFTVGWIVRDYDYDNRPLWDYTPNPLDASDRPWLKIRGLDTTGGELEFVWFDDQRGVIVEKLSPLSVSGGEATIRLPETEPAPIGGFGKSIAFLIQPVGYTPDRRFAELPNELIGQIDIQNPVIWKAERPTIDNDISYMYVARTRPEIPLGERNNYYYRWDFGPSGKTNYGNGSRYAEGWGLYSVDNVRNRGASETKEKVTVDIDYHNKRVTGDTIYVKLME